MEVRKKTVRFEYQVGDIVQFSTTIAQVHLIDGDRVWFHGTEQGESSHGGCAVGWCIRRGHWPLLRRDGQYVSEEAEAIYRKAVKLFPEQPWLRFPTYVSDRLMAWLGPQGKGCDTADTADKVD